MTSPNWNAKRPEVPVDQNGHWLHYANWNCLWEVIEQPFYAELTVTGTTSGRSAKYINFENAETGITYSMFVSDLIKSIQQASVEIKDGVFLGYWTGSKKGSNYGIKAVKPPP